jgi:hypothetical protein
VEILSLGLVLSDLIWKQLAGSGVAKVIEMERG